ncbi:MAG: hypothetical protein ACRCZ9_03070 [Fusobacteriaceae bacterium]
MTKLEYMEYVSSLRKFSEDEEFTRFLTLLTMRSANKKMFQTLKEGNPNISWSQFDLLLMDLEDVRNGYYDASEIGG